MDFLERSYSGHAFRPRPLIELEKTSNTLIVATSWGTTEHSEKVIEVIKAQLVMSSEPDATRVGTSVGNLSDEGQKLRSAAMFANDELLLKDNSREFVAAVEIALISVQKNILSWVQLGTPHILLSNKSGFQPLCYTPDWSWQMQQSSPIVSKALGLERHSYMNCGDFRIKGDEQILLVSRSALPAGLYAVKEPDLNSCSQVLVEDNSESPFWIGLWDLSHS